MDGFGKLWKSQEGQGLEPDGLPYSSGSWHIIKSVLAITPFFVGLLLGYSFQNPRRALAMSILIGLISIIINFFLMMLPYLLRLADYGPGFMGDVWFYGFFIPFLLAMSLIPAGAMVSASTNVYD